MSSGKRYKFNGSTFRVQTSLAGSPATITGVTKAKPAVVSAAAHGFALADVVQLSAIVGMTELNSSTQVVDNPASGTFELAGSDSTGYNAYVSGGIATKIVFSNFCELTAYNQQGAAANLEDVSTICSTAKEFEQGLSDTGTLQLDYNAAPLEPIHAALRNANISGAKLAVQLSFPNSGGLLTMIGTVQQVSIQGSNGSVHKSSCTMKLTGQMFVSAN